MNLAARFVHAARRLLDKLPEERDVAEAKKTSPSARNCSKRVKALENRTADVTVVRDGVATNKIRVTTQGMSAEEKTLGFPQSVLATHTEARAVRRLPLAAGDTMTIHGQYAPCNYCKGKMNEAAGRQGASITYDWPGGTWRTPR